MKITICGGGNAGHTAAALLGSRPGLSVKILTRRPTEWNYRIELDTTATPWISRGPSIWGCLEKISADPADVIPGADIILVAAPAHAHPPILAKIASFVEPNCILGSLYCQGGFDWAVHAALGEEKVKSISAIFGLQHIPWLCRVEEYGKKVNLIGPKQKLLMACSPKSSSLHVSRIVELLFEIPTVIVPNFLSLTLTPSNQIIHPARYYAIFHEWDGESAIPENKIQWGLYTEVCDLTVVWFEKLDAELQAIKTEILVRHPEVDLSSVKPLGERIVDHYGSEVEDSSSLKQIFRTNNGYKGCRTPAEKFELGYRPALKSRLFLEDIPFGLCILKSIAKMMDLKTPSIDFMIEWHQQYMDRKFLDANSKELIKDSIPFTGAPEAYGISSLEELIKFSN